jgi:hypothetical protein
MLSGVAVANDEEPQLIYIGKSTFVFSEVRSAPQASPATNRYLLSYGHA